MKRKDLIWKVMMGAAVALTMLPLRATASNASEIVKDDFTIVVSDFKRKKQLIEANPAVTAKDVQITYLDEGNYRLSYQIELVGASDSYEMKEMEDAEFQWASCAEKLSAQIPQTSSGTEEAEESYSWMLTVTREACTEHQLEKKIKESNCTVQGYEKDSCVRCGYEENVVVKELAPNTHDYQSQIAADGTYTHVCSDNAKHNGSCSGGEEATCTTRSVCDTCHKEYGRYAHELTYTAEETVITEGCAKGCGHSAVAELVLDTSVSRVYSGGEVKPLRVEYSADWAAGELVVQYQNNVNATAETSKAVGRISIGEYIAEKAFEIEKAELKLIAEDKNCSYGDQAPHYTAKIEGLVSGEKASDVIRGTPDLSCDYTLESPVGTYTIKTDITGLSADNYTLTAVDGTLTVDQRELSIQWGETKFFLDEAVHLPEAKAGNTVYGDVFALTVSGETAQAGIHEAVVTGLTGDNAVNYKLPENPTTSFSILAAAPETPVAQKETILNKGDGVISGVDNTMEYRAETETDYKSIHATTITKLKAGKYLVRTKAAAGMPASYDKEVTVEAGEPLTVSLPETKVGYTLTADKTKVGWNEEVTLTYRLKEGYTETADFAIKFGEKVLNFKDGICVEKILTDVVVTVEGIADLTPPKAEITVTAKNSVDVTRITKFLAETVTFEEFFKNIKVTIVGTDAGGIQSIHYYESTKKVEDLTTIPDTDWMAYPETGISVEGSERKLIFYVRVTDNSGNITYASSNGMVYDPVVPVINIRGGENYVTLTITAEDITETNLDRITVDGKTVQLPVTLAGNVDETYRIVAYDKAGNKSITKAVNMDRISKLEDSAESYTADSVSVSNKSVIQSLLNKIKDLEGTAEEKALLKPIEDRCNMLLAVIEIKEIAKPIDSLTKDNMKPENREAVQKVQTDISKKNGKTDEEKDLLAEIKAKCKELLENINYSITSKTTDLEWIKGSKDGLKVKTDAGSSTLKNVRIDGTILAKTNYDYKEGTLTLKASYLQKTTTKVGKHTIKLEFEDGDTGDDTSINILKAGSNPRTSDDSHLTIWCLTAGLSAAGLVAIILADRKRRHQA